MRNPLPDCRYFWPMTVNGSWDETIVAMATPPGVSALGIIRLSGTRAIAVVNALFPSKNLVAQPSHTLHVGLLRTASGTIDEVVVSLYKAPRSYTGEDVVEISCHGAPFIQQQAIEACLAQGARLARAGEFTQRAFLAGKLDLTQAEAVADLIRSNTAAAQKTALHAMRGGFSSVLKMLRESLIRFSALIELELDFAGEDVDFADRGDLKKLVHDIKQETDALLNSFALGNVIRNGVSVAIIGKPNAGKSTLLNTLLNEDRAIVSEIPGTTRDTIEEVLNIDGILFRMIDTAGIREQSADVIESAGIRKSLQKMREAQLVMYLFDIAEVLPAALGETAREFSREKTQVLFVGNKVDKVGDDALAAYPVPVIFVSARDKKNVDILKKAMVQSVLKNVSPAEDVVVTNARHYEALKAVYAALQDVLDGLANNLPGDLLALDIRRALHFLGEITGAVTNEDQLDFIFSKFCIGK